MNTIHKTFVVIDTNVALDLWLFARPGLEALHDRLPALVLVGTGAMRDEMDHVLQSSVGGAGPIAQARLTAHACAAAMSSWDQHVRVVEAPTSLAVAAPGWPRCRDASDQKFIDLALEHRAGWLLTRDRALLALARRCRGHDLTIATPEAAQERFAARDSAARRPAA